MKKCYHTWEDDKSKEFGGERFFNHYFCIKCGRLKREEKIEIGGVDYYNPNFWRGNVIYNGDKK